jgi:hypothetical protein
VDALSGASVDDLAAASDEPGGAETGDETDADTDAPPPDERAAALPVGNDDDDDDGAPVDVTESFTGD